MTLQVKVLDAFVPETVLAAMDPEVIQQALLAIMDGAWAFWVQQAGLRFHSTRRDYQAGIQPVQAIQGGGAMVVLAGQLPNLLENGMAAFDQHDTLLGPNVPTVPVGQRGKHRNKAGGFYRAIPFRHQVPGTLGVGGGAPMGSSYEGVVADAVALGRAVHAAAKRLAPTTGQPGGPVSTARGGRLPAGTGGAPLLRSQPRRMMVGGQVRTAAPHAVDIYAGMVRQQKTYGRATQNTYMTFRTISTSQPDKWLHPGLEPAHLADEVSRYVDRVAPAALWAVLNGGAP